VLLPTDPLLLVLFPLLDPFVPLEPPELVPPFELLSPDDVPPLEDPPGPWPKVVCVFEPQCATTPVAARIARV
jgi:hypothetical protein